MAKAMYEVKKNEAGEWAVFNKEDDAQVAIAKNRDEARSKKKEFELAYLEAIAENEPVAKVSTESPTEDPVAEVDDDITSQIDSFVEENSSEDLPEGISPEETAKEEEVEEPTVEAPKEKKPRSKKKEEVVHEKVADKDKIEVVTRSNWQANMDRAQRIQDFYVKHYEETGGFPSHRYMQERFQVSFKALVRHRKTVMIKRLGLDPETDQVETTSSIARTKKTTEEK